VDVIRGLRELGAEVSYVDPMVPELEVDGAAVRTAVWSRETLAAADCAVLITPHGRLAGDPAWAAARLVLDTRNELAPADNVEVL
jgi:UDP-N-acetyl-D-glucosamine dehydrogenase